MRPIAAFLHLMPDVIQYQVAGAADGYGDRTYGTAQSYRARVVGERKLIQGFSGLEVTSHFTVYVAAKIVAQPDDIITLSTALVTSTEDSSVHPSILGTKREPDQAGTHHTVLYLG